MMFQAMGYFFSNKIKKISIIHVLNSNWIIKHEFLLLSKQKNMYYAYIFSPLKNVLLTLYVMLCMMHNLNMLKCIKKNITISLWKQLFVNNMQICLLFKPSQIYLTLGQVPLKNIDIYMCFVCIYYWLYIAWVGGWYLCTKSKLSPQ